jgi:hypothetical protein
MASSTTPSALSWQRQRNEPARAHAYFEQYLALGPGRSLGALARTAGVSYAYLKKLSSQWHWQERAGSWQLNVQQAASLDAVDAAEEARARHLRDAQTLQQLARAQLARWIAKDPEGGVRLRRRLSAHQVARAWQVGYRVEHELLPPPAPPPLADAGKLLREARYEREYGEQAETPTPEPRDLATELAALLALLRRHGVSREKIVQHHAQLLRWLWLPNEETLSLSALKKAPTKRSNRNHGRDTEKTPRSRRA